MKPVFQTRFRYDRDDNTDGRTCLSAAYASILEMDLNDIPRFEDMELNKWYPRLRRWLNILGFEMIEFREERIFKGYYLVSGESARGILHLVVYKDGKLVHDPHPDGDGIKSVETVYLLIPLDPSVVLK